MPISLVDTSYDEINHILFLADLADKTAVGLIPIPNHINLVSAGVYQEALVLKKSGQFYKEIPISLSVMDGDTSDFWVSPNEFVWNVSKDLARPKRLRLCYIILMIWGLILSLLHHL